MIPTRASSRWSAPPARAAGLCAGLLALLLLPSCSGQNTGVVLTVLTDLRVPEEMDTLQLNVTVDGSSAVVDVPIPLGPEATTLPGTFGIYSDGGAQVTIVLTGSVRTGPGARSSVIRTARLTLVQDSVLSLALSLVRDCVGVTCENPNDSCIERGACVDNLVDPSTLPDFNADDPIGQVECGDYLDAQGKPLAGGRECRRGRECVAGRCVLPRDGGPGPADGGDGGDVGDGSDAGDTGDGTDARDGGDAGDAEPGDLVDGPDDDRADVPVDVPVDRPIDGPTDVRLDPPPRDQPIDGPPADVRSDMRQDQPIVSDSLPDQPPPFDMTSTTIDMNSCAGNPSCEFDISCSSFPAQICNLNAGCCEPPPSCGAISNFCDIHHTCPGATDICMGGCCVDVTCTSCQAQACPGGQVCVTGGTCCFPAPSCAIQVCDLYNPCLNAAEQCINNCCMPKDSCMPCGAGAKGLASGPGPMAAPCCP